MVIEGARGQTELEMGKTLRFPNSVKIFDNSHDAGYWKKEIMHRGMALLNESIVKGSGTDLDESAKIESEILWLEDEIKQIDSNIKENRKALSDRSKSREERMELLKRSRDLEKERSDHISRTNRLRQQINRYEMNIANDLWTERTFPFREEYLDVLNASYKAGIHAADFAINPEDARKRINRAVEEATNKRIKEILPQGVVDESTMLVVTNAIYFKGNWHNQFNQADTKKVKFTKMDGATEEINMMSQQKVTCGYADITPKGDRIEPEWDYKTRSFKIETNEDGFQILELMYRGDRVSMVIILPRRVDGLEEFEKGLKFDKLVEWLSLMKYKKVHVYIPKYKMTSTYNLNTHMANLGMPSAFKPGGFTGISASPIAGKLAISFISHKAFVEVNEKGTEAAAATAVGMITTSAKPPEPPIPTFRADHPYMFIIRDVKSGAILFLGRVMTPQ
jgi:serpin B